MHVNALKAKTAAQKALAASKKDLGISDTLIGYVERERRIGDWGEAEHRRHRP